MTLLDEYRRAAYNSSTEERARRLQPLVAQGSRTAVAIAESSVASTSTGAAKGSRHRPKAASRAVRLQELSTSDSKRRGILRHGNGVESPTQTASSGKRRASAHVLATLSVSPSARASDGSSLSNQQDTARSYRTAVADRRDSLVDRVLLLSSLAVGRSGGDASRRSSAVPTELPSQFVHGAVVSISKWTVIVSDTTLHRIAARNRRITRYRQQQLLHAPRSSTPLNSRAATLVDANQDLGTAEPTRVLVLNGAETITDAGLEAIADSVPALEVLEIASAGKVTDAGLRSLALSCPQLTRLDVSNCRGVMGPGLAAIADHAHALHDLALADCSHVGAWAVLRCVYGFPHLEHLNVARCAQVTDHVLTTLAHQCRALRSLILTDCMQVSDVGVVHVAQQCRQLETIALSRTRSTEKITDTACAALGERCPLLRDVRLAGCNFLTDAAIKWLAAGCRALERLDVSNVTYVTDVSLRALGTYCAALRSLRLANVKNVSDVGLRLLATGCHQLELLHVSNLYLVSDGTGRDFGLEGLRAIATDCALLTDVNLSGCFQLVERALVALSTGCRNLQRVNLQACPHVTLRAVNALLNNCAQLVALNLTGVEQCTNAMLAAIGAHGLRLRELVVAQCDKVSDGGLRHLALRADQYERLDFAGCVLVSDAGVIALVDGFRRPRLAHLVLAGCALVTQDAIARLAFACPMLLTLSVHGCRVSPRVLQSLSSSWLFGELRIPSSASASAADLGIFPMHRAKDWRFVHESCTEWLAVVRIQNAYRSRKARALAHTQREAAMRLYVARKLQSIWRGRCARREALVRKVLRSGRDKFATKIQRRYRAKRLGRRTQQQVAVVHEQQLETYARIVQRRYRAKRAASVARLIVAARMREVERETRAAVAIQRRFRGLADRKRVDLRRVQLQVRAREQQDATLRIQTIYRGRADRKRADELRRARVREFEILAARATQLQAQFRRRHARRVADMRRQAIHDREVAATKLQLAFRARKARQTVDVLRLARHHRECQRTARMVQRRWRVRNDRIGLEIVHQVRHERLERQQRAAVHLQHTIRRFLLRKRARGIMSELLALQQNERDMEAWAATLVQAHWRCIQAVRELERIQADKRTRWKQLIDTYNQHGMGYGAPFYYNQVNQEIRWRMPRELLVLTLRPSCDQCERIECASVECATCCEFFCHECNDVVHGHGKRQLHDMRKLYNFYGLRRDYGDGVFPSVWPSELAQDAARGYDFVAMAPTAEYQDMLWRIAQYVPVETGKWATSEQPLPLMQPPQQQPHHVSASVAGGSHSDTTATLAAVRSDISGALFNESDVDELGQSLWETFYDYAKQEYRQYHRLSKRVKSLESELLLAPELVAQQQQYEDVSDATADPASAVVTDNENAASAFESRES